MDLIELRAKHGALARINRFNGELCSLTLDGLEFMHGAGKPPDMQTEQDKTGWDHSEITMFPVVGSVKDGKINVDGTEYAMGKHGIARYLEYRLEADSSSDASAVFSMSYSGYSAVHNRKTGEPNQWPFSFGISKEYRWNGPNLEVEFTITNRSENPMPYMFGWHPAFRIQEWSERIPVSIQFEGGLHPISLPLKDLQHGAGSAKLYCGSGLPQTVTIRSPGFKLGVHHNLLYTQLWSPPDSHVLCIEPVSEVSPNGGIEAFTSANPMMPAGKSHTYWIDIRPSRGAPY